MVLAKRRVITVDIAVTFAFVLMYNDLATVDATEFPFTLPLSRATLGKRGEAIVEIALIAATRGNDRCMTKYRVDQTSYKDLNKA
jgi:hypothetical protein